MVNLLRKYHLRGWRSHYPLPGTPDFCWLKPRLALFVDGCFWHGCPRCYKTPKSNVAYWQNKVKTNRRRDRRVDAMLRRKGWAVIRTWECQLKLSRTVKRIERTLQKKGWAKNPVCQTPESAESPPP